MSFIASSWRRPRLVFSASALYRASRYASLSLGFAVICCAPDFDSLSRGTAGGAADGNAAGGESARGGADGQLAAGGPTDAGESGTVTVGAAGQADTGGLRLCAFYHPNAIAFDGFDGGLGGVGFAMATSVATNNSTVNESTASTAWDAMVGSTCPGSLRLTAIFEGYSSSATAEKAIGDLRFSAANWTGAIALHARVRVDPATSPVRSVSLFVLSGTDFLYDTIEDDTLFRNGEWNDMVLPLEAGTAFDPTSVIRIGINMVLKPAGSPGNPPSPPTTNAWLDDVWVQK